jgi:hypothetical protein
MEHLQFLTIIIMEIPLKNHTLVENPALEEENLPSSVPDAMEDSPCNRSEWEPWVGHIG